MRKLALFSLAFGAAAVLAAYILPEGYLPWAACVCAAAGLAAALIFREMARLRAIFLAAGLIAGFLYTWGYGALFYAPARGLDGQTVELTATAVDYSAATGYGTRADVDFCGIKTRLYINGTEVDIKPGDVLSVTASLRLADEQGGEETDYYKASGVYLFAYAEGELSVERPDAIPLRYWPAAARRALSEKLGELFPADVSALAKALAVGDRSEYYKDGALTSALNYSGIRHVIAISGMHLSFLIGFVRLFTGRRRRTAAVCIPLILAFMALVGFPVSVVRAGVMQIMLLAASVLRREEDPLTALAFAGLVILLLSPFAAMSASFQLSFGAMLGIVLFGGRLNSAFRKRLSAKNKYADRALSALSSAMAGTLSAMVFTAPLMAINFGYISLVSPLTNILTLWAVSLAFVLTLAAGIAGLLWSPAGAVIAWAAAWPMRYVVTAARLLSRLPFAAVFTTSRYVRYFIVYVYIILLTLLTRKSGERRSYVLPACLTAAALGLTLLLSNMSYTARPMTFTALDVGQGQCIVVTSGSLTAVIDCGGSGQNAGDAAADYLSSMGENTVDALILTHWHSDHVNGVGQLLERTDVKRLIVPEGTDDRDGFEKSVLAAAGEAEITYARGVTRLSLGETELTVYPPIGTGENEAGLAVLCSAGEYDALVTGDMDAAMERRLAERWELPDVELLMVGHHGSNNSTSEELLGAVRPETAIISVGHNSYGHPTREAMDRLRAAGADIYRTDEGGSITVRVE